MMTSPQDEPLSVDPLVLTKVADQILTESELRPSCTATELIEARNLLRRLGMLDGPIQAVPKLKGGVE